MARGLICRFLAVALTTPAVLHGIHASNAVADPAVSTVLERFLSLEDPSPARYRALRRLEAQSQNQLKAAWMDVWTESDDSTFKYTVVAEGGSGYIRSRVFRASLEAEKKIHESGTLGRAALTPDNYVFGEGVKAGDLSAVAVTPRRKDVLLVDGSIFLLPDTGDLVRIEGRLSKAPSFWIRQVNIVRSFQRIAGARVPVAVEAVASIRLGGKASFRMTYEYETINGRQVGSPETPIAPPDIAER
jgi:hypothetical protein